MRMQLVHLTSFQVRVSPVPYLTTFDRNADVESFLITTSFTVRSPPLNYLRMTEFEPRIEMNGETLTK